MAEIFLKGIIVEKNAEIFFWRKFKKKIVKKFYDMNWNLCTNKKKTVKLILYHIAGLKYKFKPCLMI